MINLILWLGDTLVALLVGLCELRLPPMTTLLILIGPMRTLEAGMTTLESAKSAKRSLFSLIPNPRSSITFSYLLIFSPIFAWKSPIIMNTPFFHIVACIDKR